MKKALIVQGGWDGHQPVQVAERFEKILKESNFQVEIHDTLDVFLDREKIKFLDLIVPIWTMGKITEEQLESVMEAVGSGVGLAGCHGGLCDAFRESVAWQFMTGGNWVAHPGGDGVKYTVNVRNSSSTITTGISDFEVESEHYYLHVDPAVEVLATTRFPAVNWYHASNGEVDIPVAWTKRWGYGRVFYNSLGHHNDIFDIPEAFELMKRGLLWAAEGKKLAVEEGADINKFKSDKKMF
ncbi:hypothetical protein GM661_05140 [Iocasia frigidifontis]|uniref:ThuA-like domain-containing protein n=1 Tax=Iocasia fonsfrigidae TaxID=2682810 RepID=A0A8A7KDB8_9FIRM|nr:ThuA domain-containing protein [Iocasia fonsfrigidae]QTL97409.1 hypothetical protein GM661_05140 [Iocasia fonsfrigidae]